MTVLKPTIYTSHQIHYFLAREVILDQALVGACGRDAEKVCKAEGNWHAVTEPHHKLVFPCLVRNLYIEDEDTEDEDAETDVNYEEGETPKLSDACTEEVLHCQHKCLPIPTRCSG